MTKLGRDEADVARLREQRACLRGCSLLPLDIALDLPLKKPEFPPKGS